MHSMFPRKARVHVPVVEYFVPNTILSLEQMLLKSVPYNCPMKQVKNANYLYQRLKNEWLVTLTMKTEMHWQYTI